MFSALKKLVGSEQAPGRDKNIPAGLQSMNQALQRRFAKGVQYNSECGPARGFRRGHVESGAGARGRERAAPRGPRFPAAPPGTRGKRVAPCRGSAGGPGAPRGPRGLGSDGLSPYLCRARRRCPSGVRLESGSDVGCRRGPKGPRGRRVGASVSLEACWRGRTLVRLLCTVKLVQAIPGASAVP